jgi:hypothetical protein
VVAACTLVAGVVSEALYVHFAVRETLRRELKPAPPALRPLSGREMLNYYIPLSLTQVLLLVASPIGSAAMSRMPLALESLAAWPVVGSVSYIFRAFGGAYNEVVVALVDERRSTRPLARFGIALAVASTGLLGVLMIPAAAGAVFGGLLDLVDPLPGMVWNCLFIILPVPAITVAQSYYQGTILASRNTRSIPESVGLFLLVATGMLIGGVRWGIATGLYFALGAFTLGEFLRTFWLWLRSRGARAHLRQGDLAPADRSRATFED